MKLFLLLCFITVACSAKDYTGYQVWRTYPKDHEIPHLRNLQRKYELDVWSKSKRFGDFEDFMIPPHLIDNVKLRLKFKGIKYFVMLDELQTAIDNTKPENREDEFKYDDYNTFDVIENWMTEFANANTRNGLTVEKVPVGVSYEGREFFAFKISTDKGLQKRAMVMDCGIHAREWISPATCTNVVNYLVDNFLNSKVDEVEFLEKIDLYVIPVANPDGYVYSWNDDRLWRKTRSPCANLPNCFGADPNRNFNSSFAGPGTSDLCCSDVYHGPYTFSEKCVEAQANFVQTIAKTTPVKAYMDIHSYGQLWMYPYGYTETECQNKETLDTIANECVAAISNVHGKRYTPGSIYNTVGVASGGSADYFYDKQNIKCSFGVELRDNGRYGFVLPASEILPTAEEVYKAILVVGKNVYNGKCD